MVTSIRLAAIYEKPVVHSLLQDYLVELSGIPGESIDYRDDTGVFNYPYLDAYWQDRERFPYFLLVDSAVAGFALVRWETAQWEIAEYYVNPEYRRRGTGLTCATLIIRKYPGTWYITYNQNNFSACILWQRLSKLFATGPVTSGMTDNCHKYLEFSTV